MSADAEQREREATLRQVAVGRRVQAIESGRMGPVLRRWVNADVRPMAQSLREVALLYVEGEMLKVAEALGQPTAELSHRERPLEPLMQWCLRGKSPGRENEEGASTYAEDLVLAFMGTLLPRLCSAKQDGITLNAALGLAAETLRDTVQGQFITGVQGADAMQAVRSKRPEMWAQRKSLKRIAMQLKSQVKPQIRREAAGGEALEMKGHRKIVHVQDYKGDLRRLALHRTPDEIDWQVMDLCWHPEDDCSTPKHRNVWLALAAMFLSLAQQASGWFEVADRFRLSQGRKRKTKMLVLSEAAYGAITTDVERWVGAGFVAEPMLVPPANGDYLTVKHHPVTGQRPPRGMKTKAHGSFAWDQAAAVAASPWTVNPYALDNPALDMADPYTAMKTAAHRRLGLGQFYLPVNMDFRGRIYYRTPWVTPQSNDLGKSLLCFPLQDPPVWMVEEEAAAWYVRLAIHFSSLHGNGVDKLDGPERVAWFKAWAETGDCSKAEEPLTLKAHWDLMQAEETNRIPIQLDGTCNGLQHLSALMRDEVGAAAVNLTAGGSTPNDIYGSVGRKVEDHPVWRTGEPWTLRLSASGLAINRSLCKGPVMVLPYGGTIEAIRLAVKAAVLAQLGVAEGEVVASSPWNLYEADGYGAFRERPLADHPLFNSDVAALGYLIYQCIGPVIPRALAAMQTLQKIGSFVGERGLAWQTGPVGEAPLWVVQAKAKNTRKRVTLKGYHLPEVIRRLTMVTQTNDIDPRAHRTGIVANFIHSLDAEHLARTTYLFKLNGGSCIGTIHDCVMCRPSETALMHSCLREAFLAQYQDDPLSRPVRVLPIDGSPVLEYGSWYEIAAAAGTTFPAPGEWQPEQVLDSQWFFN